MTPERFIQSLKRQAPAAAYLFLGAEAHQRARASKALREAALGAGDQGEGLTRYDLHDSTLAEVVDDARSLSLFASRRLILVRNADEALPKAKTAESDEEGAGSGGGAEILAAYMRDPTPGVVLLFEATRFDFEGEEKKKLERIRKFYSAIPEVVELKRYSSEEAWTETQLLARAAGLKLEPAAVGLLVEALGADVAHIASEIEKLALYAGKERAISDRDIASLVPDARSTTIFELVNALGRRDRARALSVLDTLSREGEYLPLALSFLSTQFRLALAARQANLRTSQQVQGHFSKQGIAMWGSRAEQVVQTMTKFTAVQLQRGLELIFEADRDLRSARPDDRIIMEQFVLRLTESPHGETRAAR